MKTHLMRILVWLGGLSLLFVCIRPLVDREQRPPVGEPLIFAAHYFQNDMPATDASLLGEAGYQVRRPTMIGSKIRIGVRNRATPNYQGRVSPMFANRPTLTINEVVDAVCPESAEFWRGFNEAYSLEVYISPEKTLRT